MPKSIAVRVAFACLLAAFSTLAQDSSTTASTLAPPPATTTAVATPTQAVVEYARVRNARNHLFTKSAGLGDKLIVEVENFPKLLADAGGSCAAIVLFLDTLPMDGLPPESCDIQDGTVRYLLTRSEKNDAQWHWLLGSPRHFTRKIRVSVGPTNMIALPSMIDAFPLRVMPPVMFYLWLLTTAVGLVIFIQLCRKTALIRGARAASSTSGKPMLKPYSLSRFQMAFWFFLVICAYLFMWMITGELDTITESILALIGIGAGTALGSALIDSGANEDSAAKNATTADEDAVSEGFLRDVLSDGGGISFHRFQMFVWTLALGVIFIASVFRHLAMPAFSATLLGLMGISSGTYLGFKFPEKTNREATQTAAEGSDSPAPPPPPAG
jgi:hypothetical protein